MIKNVKIRFNLNNENDRKAYVYLEFLILACTIYILAPKKLTALT